MVMINGKVVYSAVPDCDLSMVPIELSPGALNQGENEIIFKTERGTYLLTHVVIESELKEVDFPTYYFELTAQQYKDVREERNAVRLKLDFVDVVVHVFSGAYRAYYDLELLWGDAPRIEWARSESA